MKKFLFLLIVFLSIQFAYAQANDLSTDLYTMASIEVKPEFPGGINEFYKFISQNFIAPAIPGLKGKVYVTFIIGKEGNIHDVKVLKDIGYGTGEEAIRVLKLSPNWISGEQNGQKVLCSYSIPITIDIPNVSQVYTVTEVEVKPEFLGGMNEFTKFIVRNFRAPTVEGLSGKVNISYVVGTDGSLEDIKVLQDIGYDTGIEAIRVFKLSPKWKPAMIDGNVVRCLMVMPISIQSSVSLKNNYKSH